MNARNLVSARMPTLHVFAARSGAQRIAASAGLAMTALLGIAPPSAANDDEPPPDLKAICESELCRTPGDINIRLRSGEMFEVSLKYAIPIVLNGEAVTIYPGESHLIEVDDGQDGHLRLRAAQENLHPEKTLTISMSQDDEGSADTMLIVKNPLAATIKYGALMMSTQSETLVETSTCPVLGGGKLGVEHWPHEIFQLVLIDFREVDGSSLDCKF